MEKTDSVGADDGSVRDAGEPVDFDTVLHQELHFIEARRGDGLDSAAAVGLSASNVIQRDEVNEAERAFFAGHGIDVRSVVGLGLSGQAIREVTPERVVELAREADTPDSEALFLSCTDLRALEVVDRLEQELGKPVLSSNQVTLWGILRALGEPTRFSGLGRLLAQ